MLTFYYNTTTGRKTCEPRSPLEIFSKPKRMLGFLEELWYHE